MSDLLLSVDRFIVMQGVVICEGWFSGLPDPGAELELLFRGAPLPGQVLLPVDRPDLIDFMKRDLPERLELDGEAPRRWGFCLRALLPPSPQGGGGGGMDRHGPWGGKGDTSHSHLILRGRAGGGGRRAYRRLFRRRRAVVEECLLRDPASACLFQHNKEHHELEIRFREAIAKSTAPRILEIGARGSSPERVMGGHALPAGATYIGMDFRPGENVDLVGDAHRLSELLNDPVDFVFSVSTFEHLVMPWKAAVEIARVLRVGGLAYIHTHTTWPLHAIPHDFFRFSKWSWPTLFNRHTGFELLGATHADPAVITSMLQAHVHSHLYSMFKGISYLTTGCLARKISEPEVDWPVEPESILSSIYPETAQHG